MNIPILETKGVVEKGKAWGHKIGYPTANIPCSSTVLSGTYAGQVTIAGDTIVRAAAIYVDPKRKLLESHILDFSGDLYGQTITVTLLKKVAEAKEFQDETMLKQFITDTVAKVKEFFRDKE